MATKSNTGNTFDFKIFVRLMGFAKKYRLQFWVATTATITLAFFSAASPVLLMEAIDSFSKTKNLNTLWYYTLILLAVLILQVVLQFLFVYYSNWVGQHIIKDMRAKI